MTGSTTLSPPRNWTDAHVRPRRRNVAPRRADLRGRSARSVRPKRPRLVTDGSSVIRPRGVGIMPRLAPWRCQLKSYGVDPIGLMVTIQRQVDELSMENADPGGTPFRKLVPNCVPETSW